MSLGQLLYNLHDKILLEKNDFIDHNNIFVAFMPESLLYASYPHGMGERSHRWPVRWPARGREVTARQCRLFAI
jgi:hypothetical protein